MDKFLIDYITRLIKYSKVPKFQNERALSMILSLYLEEIVHKFTNDFYKFVTVELPIAKSDGTNRSTNVDYFMVNNNKTKALLIELKTERQGNNEHFWKQIKEYKILQKNKNLEKSVLRILNAPRKKMHEIKYKRQIELIGDSLANINQIEIMYIAPDNIIERELSNIKPDFIDYKIRFSELTTMIIDNNWKIISNYIKELNKPSAISIR